MISGLFSGKSFISSIFLLIPFRGFLQGRLHVLHLLSLDYIVHCPRRIVRPRWRKKIDGYNLMLQEIVGVITIVARLETWVTG